jgi:hypothetical protein
MAEVILEWKGDTEISQLYLQEAASKYRKAIELFPGEEISWKFLIGRVLRFSQVCGAG